MSAAQRAVPVAEQLPQARQGAAGAAAGGAVVRRQDVEERALAAYLGLAVGDALGASVQFMTEREIRIRHGVLRQICGGGWLHLKPGEVTDDTAMCLVLGEAILRSGAWEPRAAADGLAGWLRSRPVDIAHSVRHGIQRYMVDGTLQAPPSAAAPDNAACVRVLPLVLSQLDDAARCDACAQEQGRLTHNHPLSDAACVLLSRLLRSLVLGAGAEAARRVATDFLIAHPAFRFDPYPGNASEYVVDTVQTVLHSFFYNASFEACVVEVVNRGGDASATGALAGMLAGALHGLAGIPPRWLKKLDTAVAQRIHRQAPALVRLATARPETPP